MIEPRNFLVSIITDAMNANVRPDGTYDVMDVADAAFNSIHPDDYAETLRVVIGQWVALAPQPEIRRSAS